MSSSANGEDISLNWDLFMTPGITIRTNTPAPNTKETFWHPLSSTLIYGKCDAVLVDTFLTVKQSDDLVKWVAASGKNLTTIYITHGHGDHWFGIGALLSHFPNARAVATTDVVRSMRQQSTPEFIRNWNLQFPDQIPDQLVIADTLPLGDESKSNWNPTPQGFSSLVRISL
jgi:glyoxylase-like metal-dependent hydrolase (beta-lactamase superfamily II)